MQADSLPSNPPGLVNPIATKMTSKFLAVDHKALHALVPAVLSDWVLISGLLTPLACPPLSSAPSFPSGTLTFPPGFWFEYRRPSSFLALTLFFLGVSSTAAQRAQRGPVGLQPAMCRTGHLAGLGPSRGLHAPHAPFSHTSSGLRGPVGTFWRREVEIQQLDSH